MMQKSQTNLCRIQTDEISHGCYRLYDNCEMLVGGKNITQKTDIEHFIERLMEKSNVNLKFPENFKIVSYWKKASIKSLKVNNIELDVQFERVRASDALGIKLIGRDDFVRTHNVWINETGQHCVYTAVAVSSDILNTKFGKDKDSKIIEYTWVRNRHIDVVDFFVDEIGNIVGRVIHPIQSLDWEEFVFCIYILGVEADRLEYIFSQDDIL